MLHRNQTLQQSHPELPRGNHAAPAQPQGSSCPAVRLAATRCPCKPTLGLLHSEGMGIGPGRGDCRPAERRAGEKQRWTHWHRWSKSTEQIPHLPARAGDRGDRGEAGKPGPGRVPQRCAVMWCFRQQALPMVLLRPVWKACPPPAEMGHRWDVGLLHTLCPLLSPRRLQMQQYWEKQHQPPTCSSICLSTVCLSFRPSDNQTLISLSLLSWSRSFLSQFR